MIIPNKPTKLADAKAKRKLFENFREYFNSIAEYKVNGQNRSFKCSQTLSFTGLIAPIGFQKLSYSKTK